MPTKVGIIHDDAEASKEVSQLLDEVLPEESVLEVMQDSIDKHLLERQGSVFVVQSEADGSVSRVARKFINSVDSLEFEEGEISILALGGAKCANSALATASEVYAQSRKLKSKFEKVGRTVKVLELNIELEDISEAIARFSKDVLTTSGTTVIT